MTPTERPGVTAGPTLPRHCGLLVLSLAAALLPGAAMAQAASAPAADAAPATLTAAFGEVALHPVREVSAVVVARNDSRIAAEVPGTVLRWGPDVGARVARGALLVEIDPVDHRLARDRARAALDAATARAALARQQLQRARDLVAQNFLSREALAARETDLQLAEADVASQRLALASAARMLAKTRITAPFDASVRQRLVQRGEAVAAGTPLYVLAETAGAELSAQLSPDDVGSLRAGRDLRFVRPDGSSAALKLLRVAGTVSSPARTVEVRLAPAPGQAPLVPGRDGRLTWADPRAHVPAALLVRRDGALGVFTAVDGQARFQPLPLAQEGRATPADLAAGTRLVTQGHQALRNGDRLPR